MEQTFPEPASIHFRTWFGDAMRKVDMILWVALQRLKPKEKLRVRLKLARPMAASELDELHRLGFSVDEADFSGHSAYLLGKVTRDALEQKVVSHPLVLSAYHQSG